MDTITSASSARPDDECLTQLKDSISAVPAATTETISVPEDCTVSPTEVSSLGAQVKAVEYTQRDGHLSAARVLVDGKGAESA